MNEIDQRQLDEQLVAAAIAGDNDRIEELVDNGANVNHRIGANSLLSNVIGDYNTVGLETIRTLLKCGAQVNDTNDLIGPLSMCCYSNNGLEIAKILLTHGAQVNFRNERFDDRSPLHHAASQGKSDIAKLFLENGADVNATNSKGKPPLQLAFEKEKIDTAEVIVNRIMTLEADGKPVSRQNILAKTRAMPEIEKFLFLHNHKPLTDALLELGYKGDKTRDSIKAFLEKNKDKFEVKYAAQNKTLIDFVDFEDVEVRHAPRLQFCAAVSEVIKNNPVNKKLDDLETKQHQAQATGPAH